MSFLPASSGCIGHPPGPGITNWPVAVDHRQRARLLARLLVAANEADAAFPDNERLGASTSGTGPDAAVSVHGIHWCALRGPPRPGGKHQYQRHGQASTRAEYAPGT